MNISLQKLKEIKPRQAVYPIVILLFFLITTFIFFETVSFISTNINESLDIDDQTVEAGILKIDMAVYAKVAAKLGFPLPIAEEITESEEGSEESTGSPQASPEATGSPAPSSSVTPSPSPEASPVSKETVAILVSNSTGTAGLAGGLKSDLVTAGFSKIQTGNTTPAIPTTLIKIHSSVSAELAAEIETVIKKKYPAATTAELSVSSTYQIEITIGTQ